MDELFKKILYTGAGFASLAYQKMDELIEELKEDGKISDEEGENLFDKFKEETEKSRAELETDLKEVLEKVLRKMDIPLKEDIENLEKRITALEKRKKK